MENIKSNEAISKRDRWRILILGGSLGTTFTVKNCAEAAMRAWAGLVVACVKEELVPILESNSGKFKIKKICWYNMDSARKVLDLLEQSNTMVLWMWIEENILKKSKLTEKGKCEIKIIKEPVKKIPKGAAIEFSQLLLGGLTLFF